MTKSIIVLVSGLCLIGVLSAMPASPSAATPNFISYDHDYTITIDMKQYQYEYYMKVEAYDNITVNFKDGNLKTALNFWIFTDTKCIRFPGLAEDQSVEYAPFEWRYSFEYINNHSANTFSFTVSSYDIIRLYVHSTYYPDALHQTFNITRHQTEESPSVMVEKEIQFLDASLSEEIWNVQNDAMWINSTYKSDLAAVLFSLNQTILELRESTRASDSALNASVRKDISDLKKAQSDPNNNLAVSTGAGVAAGSIAGVLSGFALARRKPV